MKPVLILYASHDGQSQRIAQALALNLTENAVAVECTAIQSPPARFDRYSALIMVAAVRYGRHLPEAVQFLSQAVPLPLALVSVSLNARKGDGSPNGYLKKLIAQLNLEPFAALSIAGKLDYPRYRWLDKQMIRLIMHLTDGPSDGRCSVEYTDWQQLSCFAQEIASALRQSTTEV